MIVTGATVSDLNQALEALNQRYGGNIQFARIEAISRNRTRYTLRTKDSRKAGAKRSAGSPWHGERRTIAACWHAHGHFYEEVFKIKPNAVFRGGREYPVKIDAESGNWEDYEQGPPIMPSMASELCDCDE